MPRDYFPRVREAREVLRERAQEILESYLAIAAEARAAGEYEASLKALQWLIEHMPNEEGVHLVDASQSRMQKELPAGPVGPTINIGFKLGGMNEPKVLPVIEAEVKKDE